MADQFQTLANVNQTQPLRDIEPHIVENPLAGNVTWDDIKAKRDDMLHHVESRYNFDSPPEMIKDYHDFKAQLRDLVANAKAAGKEPWEVEWPHHPDDTWQPNSNRRARGEAPNFG